MKNVIITGANGFIGSLLAEKFSKHGYKVYAVIRPQSDFSSLKGLNNVILCRTENIFEIEKEVTNKKGTIIYHLAWQGVNGIDKGNVEVQIKNIDMAMKVAQFAKSINCEKLLCAGTVAEHSIKSLGILERAPAGMIYASAKQSLRIILGTYCKVVGLNHVWMQLSNVFGPTNKTGNIIGYTLAKVLNGEEALFGPGMQMYDLIYIDDLIEAIYRLGTMETKRAFYFIGSESPRPLKEYLETIGDIVGRRDLIKLNCREDDGIKYDETMFEINDVIHEIGNYVSLSFEEAVKETIKRYKK